MAIDKKETLADWIGLWLLVIGSASAIGSAEWAGKTHQAAYWPGYAFALPIFAAGAVVLLWSSRGHRRDD